MYIRVLHADARGWWVGPDEEHTCSFPLPLHIASHLMQPSVIWQSPCAAHNFQRWMSRFEQRWRAQRSAISIVNCRIPWADRVLNTYCTFGISLKVCLLQCLRYIASTITYVDRVHCCKSLCFKMHSSHMFAFLRCVIDKGFVCMSAC